MAQTKYKIYFDKMVSENKKAFDDFTRLHFEYSTDEEKYQEKFNKEGKNIQNIIREYENRLCANTERGMYNKYSTGLAEKFQNEIRRHYPLIDHIGIKVRETKMRIPQLGNKNILSAKNFSIKKIKL